MVYQQFRQPGVSIFYRTIDLLALISSAIATLLFVLPLQGSGSAATPAPSQPLRSDAAAGTARDLAGTFSQPVLTTAPIPVPVSPEVIQEDSSRAGGDLATATPPDWFIQMSRETQPFSNQILFPVVDPVAQPAADRVLIGAPVR